MTRRDVRVRGERRDNLDIERFALALIGLAAIRRGRAQTPDLVEPDSVESDDDMAKTGDAEVPVESNEVVT